MNTKIRARGTRRAARHRRSLPASSGRDASAPASAAPGRRSRRALGRRQRGAVGRGRPHRRADPLAFLRIRRRHRGRRPQDGHRQDPGRQPRPEAHASRTSSSTTCSRSSSSRPPAAAGPTCSSPRTTASARRPARACSSTSPRMLAGQAGERLRRSRSRAARSTASSTWSPSPSRPSPCTTTRAKIATPPATTDELLAAVKDGTIKAGFDAHSSYHSFGWWAAFGGKLMDDTGKCVADTTGVADAYKYFQDLQTAGAKWYDKYDDLASDFKTGKIDLIVDGPWASGGYKDALGDKLAVAPMPAGPAGPSQAADRRRRLVHQRQLEEPGARRRVRPRDGQGRERAGLRRQGRPHPGRHDDQDHRPDHPEVRRGGQDGLPAPAGAAARQLLGQLRQRPRTSSSRRATDPQKAATDACAAMNKANKIP